MLKSPVLSVRSKSIDHVYNEKKKTLDGHISILFREMTLSTRINSWKELKEGSASVAPHLHVQGEGRETFQDGTAPRVLFSVIEGWCPGREKGRGK